MTPKPEEREMPDEIYIVTGDDKNCGMWSKKQINLGRIGNDLTRYVRADLSTPAPPSLAVGELKDALRDVLKAICSDRHAVQDTLFVNGTPVGDFIMGALGEEIDFDELQMAPYRCKKTLELPLAAQSPQGSGWQDISTAPRDGTEVLVFGKQDSGEDYIDRSKVWISDSALDGRWTITFMSGYLPPTHWMPLPAPPANLITVKGE